MFRPPMPVMVAPAHHPAAHHSWSHHSAGITVIAVLIIFLFAILGAALQSRLVLLSHWTAWRGLGGGALLGAGSLGTGRLRTRSNSTTGEDSRSSRQSEHILSHLDLLDEDHTSENMCNSALTIS